MLARSARGREKARRKRLALHTPPVTRCSPRYSARSRRLRPPDGFTGARSERSCKPSPGPGLPLGVKFPSLSEVCVPAPLPCRASWAGGARPISPPSEPSRREGLAGTLGASAGKPPDPPRPGDSERSSEASTGRPEAYGERAASRKPLPPAGRALGANGLLPPSQDARHGVRALQKRRTSGTGPGATGDRGCGSESLRKRRCPARGPGAAEETAWRENKFGFGVAGELGLEWTRMPSLWQLSGNVSPPRK